MVSAALHCLGLELSIYITMKLVSLNVFFLEITDFKQNLRKIGSIMLVQSGAEKPTIV